LSIWLSLAVVAALQTLVVAVVRGVLEQEQV
jgi:hypothetical protein